MLPHKPRVVITGASSGLGRAFAVELAARSGHLVLADIDPAGLEETAELVRAAGGRSTGVLCDVARADAVEELRDRALAELGHVDLLINNAGVAVAGAVGAVPLTDWTWIMGINLWGVIYGCHFFLPSMRERRAGHVLNVASIAGFAQAPEMAPYNVTKAGVIALTETLAAELRPHGVGATVLCPWFFQTNIAKSARSHTAANATEQIEKWMKRSSVQATQVAQAAIHACDKGKLYAFPHREARMLQMFKRSAPSLFHQQILSRAPVPKG